MSPVQFYCRDFAAPEPPEQPVQCCGSDATSEVVDDGAATLLEGVRVVVDD